MHDTDPTLYVLNCVSSSFKLFHIKKWLIPNLKGLFHSFPVESHGLTLADFHFSSSDERRRSWFAEGKRAMPSANTENVRLSEQNPFGIGLRQKNCSLWKVSTESGTKGKPGRVQLFQDLSLTYSQLCKPSCCSVCIRIKWPPFKCVSHNPQITPHKISWGTHCKPPRH